MPETFDIKQALGRDQLKTFFHIASWLPEYTSDEFRGDLSAGLTVGVMLIPQSMAYAILAGLPPIYGLYASLVPLLIYPLLGTSRHLAIGTIAIDMMIVGAGLSVLAEKGTGRYVELAILLAFMVGGLQILMGVAQLGNAVNFVSRPVIAGFTSAAALIIAFSQLENLLGLPLPHTQHIYVLLWEAIERIQEVHLLTLEIGLCGIFLLIVFQRWKLGVPGPIAVVVLGALVVWALDLSAEGVDIVGEIPTGLPSLTLPAFGASTLRDLFPTALTLALVQFMTVVSLGKSFARQHNYSIHPNRELLAIGASNLIGSFFRSIPVSGSFSRSAVHSQTGACTPLANVFAASVIGLTLLFLTPLFYHLPVPIFAAIIIVAAFGLFDLREMRVLLRTKRIDGVIAILTFITTLAIGIQTGIITGIIASMVAIMYRISRPNVAIMGHLPGTRSFRDVEQHERAQSIEGLLLIRVDASFTFANAELLKDLMLTESEPEHNVHAIVVDASSVNDLDTTAVDVLLSVVDTLKERNVELYFGGVKTRVMTVIKRAGLQDKLGEDHFFLSPHRAVKHVLTQWGESEEYLEEVPGEQVAEERS